MAKFLFIYHGGKRPETPEAGKDMMARWQAWMRDTGNNFVDMGAPLGMSKTVMKSGVADNGGANPAGGYSVIEAADMTAALAVAQACPLIADDGSVEVAEFHSMSMDGS